MMVMMMMMIMMIMMIMYDDVVVDDNDDEEEDDDDGDGDVERTRTGPYVARSDLDHQVNYNAKNIALLSRFQLIRRRRANRRGQNEVFGR